MGTDTRSSDLKLVIELAKKAGEIGMRYFKAENRVWYKHGNSPVSQADREIDDFLRNQFAEHRPQYGWLSEETEDDTNRLDCHRVVIVDPIDGTRGFINGSTQWCISAAIVENGRPTEAVLYCPALNETFAASTTDGLVLENVKLEGGRGSRKTPLVTASKKLIEIIDALENQPLDTIPFVPSLAYRLAMVATDQLDGAFARAGASEWDVVAADLILQEAGCKLTDSQGQSLVYNKQKVGAPALVAAHETHHEHILGLAKSSGILH